MDAGFLLLLLQTYAVLFFISIALVFIAEFVEKRVATPTSYVRAMYIPSYIMITPFAILLAIIAIVVAFQLIRLIFSSPIPSLILTTLVFIITLLTKNRVAEAINSALRPWLITFWVLGIMYITVKLWIPKADWQYIFAIELWASRCDIILHKVLPESVWWNLGLMFILFLINIARLNATKWIDLSQNIMKRAQFIAACLAVFTSFTLFGTGAAASVREATAEEQYNRLKDQAASLSELVLAARLTEQTQAEAQNTKEFLDAVYAGVHEDLELQTAIEQAPYLPPPTVEPAPAVELSKTAKKLRSLVSPAMMEQAERALAQRGKKLYERHVVELVEDRISELREVMQANTSVQKVEHFFNDGQIAMFLTQILSPKDQQKAKSKFEDSLDEFVKDGAKWSEHPLAVLLVSVDAPTLLQDVIKEIYKSEVSHSAKTLITPLADALFRDPRPAKIEDLTKINMDVEHPVFHLSSLPRAVLRPTPAERKEQLIERESRSEVKNIVEKAIREVK